MKFNQSTTKELSNEYIQKKISEMMPGNLANQIDALETISSQKRSDANIAAIGQICNLPKKQIEAAQATSLGVVSAIYSSGLAWPGRQ